MDALTNGRSRAGVPRWLIRAGALESPAAPLASLLVALMIASVGVLDWKTGPELSFSIVYLVPLALAALWLDSPVVVLAAVAAAGTWLTVELASGRAFSHPFIPYWNAVVRLGFFLLGIGLVRAQRKMHRQARLVAEARLAKEVERRRALELKVAEIAASEQTRLAHDLHDGVGQYLAGLSLRARGLADDLQREESAHAGEAARLVETITAVNREIRGLGRLLGSAPAAGQDLGEALRRLVREVRELFSVQCELRLPDGPLPLEALQLQAGFRIAQEALSNAIKHAHAAGIEVELRRSEHSLELAIRDRGPGLPANPGHGEGAGLKIMRHRAEVAGAQLTIRNRDGGGCEVQCILRLAT